MTGIERKIKLLIQLLEALDHGGKAANDVADAIVKVLKGAGDLIKVIAGVLHDLPILKQLDLVALQRCGINVGRTARLQEEAKIVTRPFIDDFMCLIGEFGLTLPEVAARADADFEQPKSRVRAVRLDILSRAELLRRGALDAVRVTDLVEIRVPADYALDCVPPVMNGSSRRVA
jgi:hypothetical protein